MVTPSIALVRWQELSPEAQAEVRALTIPQQQIEYAGTLERAIAACEEADLQDVAGLAILLNSTPVGFVNLSRGKKKPDWAPVGSIALTAMRVNASMQGKGLGKKALAAADDWIALNWPGSSTIALSVDDENAAGQRAYKAAGYSEYSEPKQGRIGLVRYMSKALARPPGAA